MESKLQFGSVQKKTMKNYDTTARSAKYNVTCLLPNLRGQLAQAFGPSAVHYNLKVTDGPNVTNTN